MTQKTGRFAIIEQLLADGITHMFGNPGTVEQGFLDALSDYPEMKYILTLQESVAVMAARAGTEKTADWRSPKMRRAATSQLLPPRPTLGGSPIGISIAMRSGCGWRARMA